MFGFMGFISGIHYWNTNIDTDVATSSNTLRNTTVEVSTSQSFTTSFTASEAPSYNRNYNSVNWYSGNCRRYYKWYGAQVASGCVDSITVGSTTYYMGSYREYASSAYWYNIVRTFPSSRSTTTTFNTSNSVTTSYTTNFTVLRSVLRRANFYGQLKNP